MSAFGITSKQHLALPVFLDWMTENYFCDPDTGRTYSKRYGRGRNSVREVGSPEKGDRIVIQTRSEEWGRVCIYRSNMVWCLSRKETIEIDMEIDHINRMCGDDRLVNLRKVTSSQNKYNTGLRSHNTSGHRGVWQSGDKWVARITVVGVVHTRHGLVSLDEAIRVRMDLEAQFGVSQYMGDRE